MYFSLNKHIFVTKYESSLIILDTVRDTYLSLIDDAVLSLEFVLAHSFSKNDEGVYCADDASADANIKDINSWITQFLDQGIIIPVDQPSKKIIHPQALQPGGLQNYQWDTKKDWRSFKDASFLGVVRACISLFRIQRAIKKGGMKAIFDLIATTKSTKVSATSAQSDIDSLIAAVDCATKLWPKKIFCLGWASTFVLEARKRGIDCNLMIGIQTNPFYAHAWAELADGTVVHDDPQVKEVLSIIAQIPEEMA